MPENDRIIDSKLAVKVFDVGTADAAHLDLNQAAVGGMSGTGYSRTSNLSGP